MKYKLKLVLILWVVSHGITSYAQTSDNRSATGLSITMFKEQITLPLQKTNALQKHWGGTLAYEVSKKRSGAYQYAHIFQGGYYYHDGISQVAFIAWKPKFELNLGGAVSIHAILGVGYAHSFLTQPSYEFKDGGYVAKKDKGASHFMPSVGIGSGVSLESLLSVPITLFVRYEGFSLAPYKTKGSLPLTVNTMLSFGVKYSFN